MVDLRSPVTTTPQRAPSRSYVKRQGFRCERQEENSRYSLKIVPLMRQSCPARGTVGLTDSHKMSNTYHTESLEIEK